MIRNRWANTSFDRHNEYCREKGYHAAIIPNKPFWYRVRWMLQSIRNDFRQWLALKIAPWLAERNEP